MRGAAVAPIVFEKKERSVSRGLRLPESLDQQVKAYAEEQAVSENLVIVKLLKYAFEELAKERARRK